MEKADYTEIFTNAFTLTWKNRFLWFFGFLILLGTFYTNYDFGAANTSQSAVISFIGVIVFLFLYVVRILATAATIRSANNIPVYRNSSPISILKETRDYFLTLFTIEILLGFFLLLVFFVMSLPIGMLFILKVNAMGVSAIIFAAIIFIPLAVTTFFIRIYAFIYAVVGKNKTIGSIEMAYGLFKNNIKKSLLMALFSVIVLLVFFFGLALFLFLAVVLLGGLSVLLFLVNKMLGMAVGAVSVAAAAAFVLVCASFMQAFMQVAWVLFSQKISFLKEKESASQQQVVLLENIPDAGTI